MIFPMLSGTFQQRQRKEEREKNCRENPYKVYHEMEKKKGRMNQMGWINMSENYKRKNFPRGTG